MSSFPVKVLVCVMSFLSLVGVTGVVVALSRQATKKPPNFAESSGGEWGRTRSEPSDYINRVHVLFSQQQRFGIICPRLRDPNNPEQPKRLTRDERGITNNTCVRIDGYEYLYGVEIPGVRYAKENGRIMKEVPIPGKPKDRAWMSVWESEYGRLRVTQTVEIVMGEQTRLYDTALVKYHVWNRDNVPHTVGLRVLLDTFIGANDGVPFYLPPTEDTPARLVDTMAILNQKQIPDYLQALETGNLADKNATVAILCPKIAGCEPMERLVICRWPQNSEARWGGTNAPGDWPYEPMDKNPNAKDSAVAMYWAQTTMKPNEQRTLAFTYGLGRMGNEGEYDNRFNGRMRLFVGNRTKVNRPVTISAYIKSTDPKQTVTLKLPAGLALLPGESAQQVVPAPGPAGYAQVTWRVQGAKSAAYPVEADAPHIGVAGETVYLSERSLFD